MGGPYNHDIIMSTHSCKSNNQRCIATKKHSIGDVPVINTTSGLSGRSLQLGINHNESSIPHISCIQEGTLSFIECAGDINYRQALHPSVDGGWHNNVLITIRTQGVYQVWYSFQPLF